MTIKLCKDCRFAQLGPVMGQSYKEHKCIHTKAGRAEYVYGTLIAAAQVRKYGGCTTDGVWFEPSPIQILPRSNRWIDEIKWFWKYDRIAIFGGAFTLACVLATTILVISVLG